MMRKIVGRLALTVFIVTILVLFQFIYHLLSVDFRCFELLRPNTFVVDQFYTAYGFPLTVLVTHTIEDCPNNPTTNIADFSIVGLLVDILFIGVLGALPYFSLMRKFVNGRLALTVFIIAILVLCQFTQQIPHVDVIRCSLVDQNQIIKQFYTAYGFPLPVLITYTTGDCLNSPTTNTADFSMGGLFVDILFIGVLGALPYLSSMRKFVNRRLALTVFFIAILVMCQSIPQRGLSQFNFCSPADVQYEAIEHFSTTYGFPMTVAFTWTTINRCSGNQNTNIFGPSIENLLVQQGPPSLELGLLVDILFVVVLGTLPYWFSFLLQRFRRRDIAG